MYISKNELKLWIESYSIICSYSNTYSTSKMAISTNLMFKERRSWYVERLG